MGTHWTDKRAGVALVGQELAKRGWQLHGFHEDQSDSMTDYYAPAHWDGVAEHESGAVVCVDVCAGDVKHASGGRARTRQVDAGPCERCHGGQAEIRGADTWTIERARQDPAGWHAYRHPGTISLSGVVSPIPFFGCAPQSESYDWPGGLHGLEKCHGCHGTGRKLASESYTEPWPTFQACPKGCTWHVERGGRILAKGTGVYAVAHEEYHRDRPKLAALVDRIEAAVSAREVADNPSPGKVAGDGVTLRPSSTGRAGFVELVFQQKPTEDVRAELKRAGFRWARHNACWYGPESKLPIRWSGDGGHAPDIDLAAGY